MTLMLYYLTLGNFFFSATYLLKKRYVHVAYDFLNFAGNWLKTLVKPRSFPGASPMGPHQGFALHPLWASRRPPYSRTFNVYTSLPFWLCARYRQIQ